MDVLVIRLNLESGTSSLDPRCCLLEHAKIWLTTLPLGFFLSRWYQLIAEGRIDQSVWRSTVADLLPKCGSNNDVSHDLMYPCWMTMLELLSCVLLLVTGRLIAETALSCASAFDKLATQLMNCAAP